ncbi:MAG: hypothetical protein RML40_10905 [Bacteroidota bacterium]|nr:hypothetical protein [Candidatus Kapabacteria bacterium]MDW8221023.1 hypothetical protein [Bacteroidota bacterium]
MKTLIAFVLLCAASTLHAQYITSDPSEIDTTDASWLPICFAENCIVSIDENSIATFVSKKGTVVVTLLIKRKVEENKSKADDSTNRTTAQDSSVVQRYYYLVSDPKLWEMLSVISLDEQNGEKVKNIILFRLLHIGAHVFAERMKQTEEQDQDEEDDGN